MGKAHTIIGRVTAVLAVAVGLAWLGWRTGTIGDAPWWLGVPSFVVELGGLLAVAVLAWALWRRPESARPLAHPAGPPVDAEIVVRCTRTDPVALRATLVAARSIAPVLVVDPHASPDLAAMAVEHGVRYVATDPDERDGLHTAADVVQAASFLLLESGDVPHPAVLRTLLPWFDEPSVAVVQGPVMASAGESAEHGSGGRHDLQFERRALVPALGARGLAPFVGSGALLRTEAVRRVALVRSSSQMVAADLTSALFHAGWQIAAPGGSPVVAVAPITSPAELEDVRACEASAARHLLLGDHGALRPNRLSLAQRLSLVAQAVRPLAGVRRGATIVLLIGVLLAGRLPFEPDPVTLGALWAPWFALSALALHLLSHGEMRPGDRVRWSMRMLGASWRGVMAPDGRPDPAEHVLGSAFGLHHGVAPAAAIGAISVVIGMRAVSDRLTHTLAAMPVDRTAGLLIVALWSLAGGLDALRILARRAQTRRATRIASSLPSTFGDRSALVVDLTPLGAGVLGDADLPVGSHQRLEVVLPTASGVVSASVPAVVRNVRLDFSGERRYGVEFGALEPYVADAFTEYCVVQPAIELLGGTHLDPALAGVRPVVVLDDQPVLPRRMGLRAAALVAVAGAMAAAVPTAEAADPGGRLQGVIEVSSDVATDEPVMPGAGTGTTAVTVASTIAAPVDTADLPATEDTAPTPDAAASTTEPASADDGAPVAAGTGAAGATVVVVCAESPGADGLWGTSDDVYLAPVSTEVGADGTWSLDLSGRACWAAVAPPPGLMVRGETGSLESPASPQPLDLAGRSAPRVELVASTSSPVAGTTGTTGTTESLDVDDVVWSDADADGVLDADEQPVAGVTITLLDDATGVVRGTDVTDDAGRFTIAAEAGRTYRLAVTNLPAGLATPSLLDVLGRSRSFVLEPGTDVDLAIGLPPIDAAGASEATDPAGSTGQLVSSDGDAVAGTRLLAAPSDDAVVATGSHQVPVGAWLVVVLATLIGVSVLAGSLRPHRSTFAPTVPRAG
ncbi:MAG: SdrD B-like domain-containing protein [Acidimicrobiales bacterium]